MKYQALITYLEERLGVGYYNKTKFVLTKRFCEENELDFEEVKSVLIDHGAESDAQVITLALDWVADLEMPTL